MPPGILSAIACLQHSLGNQNSSARIWLCAEQNRALPEEFCLGIAACGSLRSRQREEVGNKLSFVDKNGRKRH